MSLQRLLALAAIAALPLAAFARQPGAADDPATPVEPPVYRSVLERYQAFAADVRSPDTAWRFANNEAGRLGGHGEQMADAPSGAVSGKPAPMPAEQEWSPLMPHGHHHHH
jgi:hypothetical protein